MRAYVIYIQQKQFNDKKEKKRHYKIRVLLIIKN